MRKQICIFVIYYVILLMLVSKHRCKVNICIFRILQLLNKRYLEKLKEDWWKDKRKCEKVEDQSDGISIQNIGGVFIVIFVGIGMACLTLIFEYYWYKYRKSTKIIDVAEDKTKMVEYNVTDFRKRESDPKSSMLRPRNVTNTKTKF